ncbi:RAD55 family ATPase [Roseimaritima ulvae]|uniref:KaiC n=1 Tax=Roseimaritima ulvae TaxID=980254 RepID=A0A5B9QVK9_9BACT|nr:hypothetical protein [Roseimaritima ulvae]QEG41415.1 KaiC [Roseimaritima ulvae]
MPTNAMDPTNLVLRFGVPSLDRLLGRPYLDYDNTADPDSAIFGIGLNSLEETEDSPTGKRVRQDAISVCMIGIDGVGKSTLAMHLASRYRADLNQANSSEDDETAVIYVSTDLTFGRADVSWRTFGLDYPDHRIEDPFDVAHVLERHSKKANSQSRICLKSSDPQDNPLGQQGNRDRVHFIDLATKTTGDDWGYINRLVGSLDDRKSHDAKHLLVVDAVEGLEVLVGEIDAYGQQRDRRSRVAQLIRTAAAKCHLVFLVEDTKEGEKTPEEFVADAVIRLTSREVDGYLDRIVQVEKVRSQSQTPGAHSIIIRPGSGSTTGVMLNADDPPVYLPAFRQQAEGDPVPFPFLRSRPSREHRQYFQAYVYVLQSLDFINRQVMTADGDRINTKHAPLAGFGIENLDNMLTEEKPRAERGEEHGLMTSDPVALIGEDGTYKSKLSKAFLAQGMRLAQESSNKPRTEEQSPPVKQAVILITTKTLDCEGLRERIIGHLGSEDHLDQQRIFCRRLEVHMMSAETLFHIIRQTVQRAQAALLLDLDIDGKPNKNCHWIADEKERRAEGWRIRLVIDNWASIRDMYPRVREDPLFLPCLMFYLRREGIATIIVGNEGRGFSNGFILKSNHRLRELTATQIYTWRVPFLGESRVAITITPPLQANGRGSVIRELRVLKSRDHSQDSPSCEQEVPVEPGSTTKLPKRPRHGKANCSYRVVVNRELELYEGLEAGKPEYVPMRVHLYVCSPGAHKYFDSIRHLFNEITNSSSDDRNVLFEEQADGYDRLREFVELQGLARYPYTMVLQVDEYWSRSQSLQLHDHKVYLTSPTAEVIYTWDESTKSYANRETFDFITEDPFRLYQPSESDQKQTIDQLNSKYVNEHVKPDEPWTYSREQFFQTNGFSLSKMSQGKRRVQKIPYAWDFGFLMINRSCWKESASKGALIEWKDLPTLEHPNSGRFRWREFAECCVTAARQRNQVRLDKLNYVPFSIAPEIQETISCLFLEIFCSEIDANLAESNRKIESSSEVGRTVDDVFPHSRDKTSIWTLSETMECFSDEACKAILIMSALLPPECITDNNVVTPPNSDNNIPVAVRAWYSAADTIQQTRRSEDIYVPGRLPGSRSVRGDWFIATARGSRSHEMGERAIDLLCSRRGNIVRLQHGIGLPTRDCNHDEQAELWTSLWHHSDSNRRTRKVMLDELVRLGSHPCTSTTFQWLWRSRFKQYDRHARVLRRWICSTLRMGTELLDGKTPFEVYDAGIGERQKWQDRVMSFTKSLTRATIAHQDDRDVAP